MIAAAPARPAPRPTSGGRSVRGELLCGDAVGGAAAGGGLSGPAAGRMAPDADLAAGPPSPADPVKLDAYITGVAELQAGEVASRRLLALTSSDGYDMREVVRCVECDPALTAKLLRVVNGARYGLRHRVTGVRRAAAYVGRKSLRLLAVTFSLADRFSMDKPLHAAVWRRAVVSAAAAAELAKRGESPAADEAYTAALLSDLGVMLLGGYDPTAYPGVHADTPHGACLLGEERARFGTDHAEVGGKFLTMWGLPQELAAAAAGHHLQAHDRNADGSRPAPLDVVVRVADRLADAVLSPTEDRVREADDLVREWFPGRPTGRILAGILAAAAEDADLYPGVDVPDARGTLAAWSEFLTCPELMLAGVGFGD